VSLGEEAELDRLPVAELERGCALQRPRSCLASARAFEGGRDVGADPKKARVYRALAVSLLDQRCIARDAESCHDLAALYSTGTGVLQNPATARALAERARLLCAGKPTESCRRLGDP
jgi:TPR repeat protein